MHQDNQILIICDNHESHISIAAVNYCRDNGIIYLTLSPHTSHKLQPLDVCVFGSFKSKLKIAFNDWHIRTVGKTLSIYNIAELSKLAFLESFTPKNITSGFSKPEIWPFDRLAFGDDNFALIEIFDVSTQNEGDENKLDCEGDGTLADEANPLDNQSDTVASPNVAPSSKVIPSPNVVPSSSTTILSPEAVRPYPKKVVDGKASRKGREKGKSRVYTETPEIDSLQILEEQIERKLQLKLMKQKAKALNTAKNLLGLTETKKSKKKRVCPRFNRSPILIPARMVRMRR